MISNACIIYKTYIGKLHANGTKNKFHHICAESLLMIMLIIGNILGMDVISSARIPSHPFIIGPHIPPHVGFHGVKINGILD